MDSFKIVFVKDTFKCENRLSEIHFLTKFWSKVVFRKDDFEKYKNFGHKVSLEKTILRESVFRKNNFEKYKNFGQKVSLEKTILRNVKILVRKCLSERRFSHLKVSLTKTILNESIFQINITRAMFGSKTLKKKNVFFSKFSPLPEH